VTPRQSHPSQTGRRVGDRLSVICWSSRLGVGCGANNSTHKKFLVTRFFKNCTAKEEGGKEGEDLGEKGWEGVEWMCLAQDRD